MSDQLFEQHFSVDEAEEWIPRLRQALPRIAALIGVISPDLEKLRPVIEHRGNGGGIDVVKYVSVDTELASLLEPIQSAGILLKDVDRGLVDFPHLRESGEEVFLCWQLADGDRILWYHELRAGFDGRRQLD